MMSAETNQVILQNLKHLRNWRHQKPQQKGVDGRIKKK